ncbi:aldo/keto reductase [Haloarchaeobius sp. TZWSO28]|uniref:aldo/keto reductase n=1 Tax=Haloarchaeobius sp. TZWSO28 TaxID=3446119 RepID=UPI003EBA353D
MQGVSMPRLGIGTWPITDRDRCVPMVQSALEAGYRHVDTAQMYNNEAHVGEAIEAADVPREELFVATKLVKSNLSYDAAIEATKESLERLRLDTLDLLYVHFPRGDYDPEETLPALDELVDRGLVRHIGLSNFTPAYLDEALDVLDHELYAHQAEMHPLLHQRELRAYALEHGHRFVAHTPLARGEVFDVALISEIAAQYDISEAELTLAWLCSKENVHAIPKSTNSGHLRENFGAQELAIDAADLERIDALHEWRQQRVNNPDNPAWKWQLNG